MFVKPLVEDNDLPPGRLHGLHLIAHLAKILERSEVNFRDNVVLDGEIDRLLHPLWDGS